MKFNVPKERAKESGVYMISNAIDARVYIGSSVNLYMRYKTHCTAFRYGNCNPLLRKFIKEHSLDQLEFSVLEYGPRDRKLLDIREKHFIMKYNAIFVGSGFNISTNKLGLSNYSGPFKLNKDLVMPSKKGEEQLLEIDYTGGFCKDCGMLQSSFTNQLKRLEEELVHYKDKCYVTEQELLAFKGALGQGKRNYQRRQLPMTNQLSLFQ